MNRLVLNLREQANNHGDNTRSTAASLTNISFISFDPVQANIGNSSHDSVHDIDVPDKAIDDCHTEIGVAEGNAGNA